MYSLEMYSQEVLNSNTDEIQLHIRLSRDFLDVSESINVRQNLQEDTQHYWFTLYERAVRLTSCS